MGIRGSKIIQELPDIPRWIYARWIVLTGEGRVYARDGFETTASIIQHPTNGLTCVIGQPDADLVLRAIEAGGDQLRILTSVENYRYIENILPGWELSPVYIHILPHKLQKVTTHHYPVRFLDADELSTAQHVPDELKSELMDAMLRSPIAALFVDGNPVSFCYVAAETETLWDISIDTLAKYRNKGYAAQAATYTINFMHKKGKRPIWGAEESNPASIKLAQKLGFKAIDRLYLHFRKPK